MDEVGGVPVYRWIVATLTGVVLVIVSQLPCVTGLPFARSFIVRWRYKTTSYGTSKRRIFDFKSMRFGAEYTAACIRLGYPRSLQNTCTYHEFRPPADDMIAVEFDRNNVAEPSWLLFNREVNHTYEKYRTDGLGQRDARWQYNRTSRYMERSDSDDLVVDDDPDRERTELAWYIEGHEDTTVDRPLASMNTGDLVVLIRRLGMRWKQLRPTDNVLEATGNGFTLTTTGFYKDGHLCGLATTTTRSMRRLRLSFRMQSRMSYYAVVMPTYSLPGVESFKINDEDGEPSLLLKSLRKIGVLEGDVAKVIGLLPKNDKQWSHVLLADLLCLLSPFVLLESSPVNGIVPPFTLGRSSMMSPLHTREGRDKLLKVLTEMRQTCAAIESLLQGPVLDDMNLTKIRECKLGANEEEKNTLVLRELHTKTIDYFEDLVGSLDDDGTLAIGEIRSRMLEPNIFSDLIASHIGLAIRACSRAEKRPAAEIHDVVVLSQYYIDELPRLVAEVQDRAARKSNFKAQLLGSKVVEVAWWILMLRGVCWSMSVSMEFRDDTIPSCFHRRRGGAVWIE